MQAATHEVEFAIDRARTAQGCWAEVPIRERLQIVRRIRNEIANASDELLDAFERERSMRAERLAAEVIPLAEACQFLERKAAAILAPRTLKPRRTPFWLRGISLEERREPVGVVLIIGPANYPLFLSAVQALQALVAGNAVLIKPGRKGYAVLQVFSQLAHRAGVPEDLLTVLEEDVAAAKMAIAEGVDKIVFTGSAENGRTVYRQAADQLTPVVMELSGCDPVFVQAGADLERAVQAIAFGLRWNGGDTCSAPRRIFVDAAVAEQFEAFLSMAIAVPEWIPITRYETEEQALQLAGDSPYALGASVFGPAEKARALAARIAAGIVVVNDMIVPTADPHVAFGGRGQSGFGKTRGAEGLLEMTTLKVILVQKKRRLRHLEPLPTAAEQLFSAYLKASWSTRWSDRVRSWFGLFWLAKEGKR